MKVLHVIPSVSPAHGGPTVAMSFMARSLVQAGVQVDVATTDDDGPGKRAPVPLGQRVESDGYGTFFFPKQTEFYKISLLLSSWLKQHVTDYDLVHVHALFSYTSTCASRLARRKAVPYVLRPLGVLNHWGLRHRRRALKALSFRFLEKSILRHAAAMHYTSAAEQADAERAGACAPGEVIPLGIDPAPLQARPGPERFLGSWPAARGRDIVLFLGRLDPIKGLELLLSAFARVKTEHAAALLVLAGRGDEDSTSKLRRQAAALGLEADVLWTGFLAGEEKLSALSAATLFVLPSHSENFGLVVAEALACGLPVITTRGTPWEELETHRCGWWVDAGVEPLARALRQALGLPHAERREMGERGRRLIESKYTWPRVAARIKSLYERILELGPKQEGAAVGR